jgi:hypothetical protein
MNDEHNYWDGNQLHYCVDVYQSAQDATMACGKILSTWHNPDLPKQHKYSSYQKPACDVGYSFVAEEVDCPECRIWIEANCPSCRKCGVKCSYGTCRACIAKEVEEAGGMEAWTKKVLDEITEED